MHALPRFLVLGGPIPPVLKEGLAGNVALVTELEPDQPQADGVIVHAVGDVIPAIRKLRATGADLPVYGWSDLPVDVVTRISWIREGADDLLFPENAVEALIRRIRGEADRAATHPDLAARLDRYLDALQRYVGLREEIVRNLGVGGRTRILDCTFRRDQVMRASDIEAIPDAFGQRRGGERETLDWPARVLSPYGSPCRIVNIGAEGLCLALPRAPMQGQVLRIEVDSTSSAMRLDLEVRWQRRTSRDRWEAGALAVACQRTRTTQAVDPGKERR